MEVLVFAWWWTSHQSSAHKSLRIFRFCLVSWYPRAHTVWKRYWRASKVYQNTELWTELMVSQLNSSGIFSTRIHHIAAQPQSSRVTVEIGWNTREFYRTDHFHVDVQRHLMRIERQQERMRVKCSTRFSLCEKIRSRTMVIPRAWIREKVVFYQWRVHKVNGTQWLKRWWWHSQKADTQSSEPRVHCPEECLKAKVVENCWYIIVPTRKRLKLFFAHLLL